MDPMSWTSLLLLSSFPPPNVLLLLLAVAILLLSSYYYYYYVKPAAGRHGDRQLPPGSFGLPLCIGENLHFLIGNNGPLGTPRPFLSSRLRKYGTIFKTHLLGYPTVISMDVDFNKLLLSNEGKLVKLASPDFMKKILGPNADLHGEAHYRRRELMKSVLNSNAIQNIHFIPLQEYACNFLHSWSNMLSHDAQHENGKFAFMYIVKFLLNLAPKDPDTLLLYDDYQILLEYQSSVPIDIRGTTFNQILKARERISTKLGELVAARRKVKESEFKDFMDTINRYDNTLTNQEIVDIMLPFIIAAIDTTSTLLTNIFKLLSENPHVVDELREEHTFIRRNKTENELLTWDEFKQMQFTKCVIKETLRISNIAEFVAREALKDIIVRDMVIPKGWRILVNFSMIHLNPGHYENPGKFDPWRWQDKSIANNQALFTPFSGGMRMCVGPLIAEVEVSIFIHYLITRYKWHVLKDKDRKLGVVSGHFVTKMQKGLPIKIAPL